MLAKYSDSPKDQEYLASLERSLMFCKIPANGISQPPGVPVHAAFVFFLIGDHDSAAAALSSTDYSITDEQRFALLSYAAINSDAQVLKIVLDAGIDPKLRQPQIGVTALMEAAHLDSGAADRMRRFAELGVDPLAESVAGFSALDFAVAAENDEAVELVLSWIDGSGPESFGLVRRSITVAHTVDENRAAELEAWLAQREAAVLDAPVSCGDQLAPSYTESPRFPYWTINRFTGTAEVTATVQTDGTVVNPRIIATSDWTPIATKWDSEKESYTEPLGYENAILDAVSRYTFPPVDQECSIALAVEIDQSHWDRRM